MKKLASMMMLLAVVMTASATVKEARYVVCDSTHSLLSGVKMEFLRINSIPVVSSYDGLLRWTFPKNVETADVMLTGEGLDTLYTTLRRSDTGLQWIVMKRSPRQPMPGIRDDLYYSLASPKGRTITRAEGKARREATKMATTAIGAAEVETMAVVEDAAVLLEADGAMSSYGKPRPEVAANAPQAGKLTAGEVNDFAKWHLWTKILDQSHAQYVSTWGLNVRERYRVQVTNKQHFPLVDAEVTLVDAEGNELFAARTDNTGHAELWGDVNTLLRPTATCLGNSYLRTIASRATRAIGSRLQSQVDPQAAGDCFTPNIGEEFKVLCYHNGICDTLAEPKLFPEENRFELDAECRAPEHVDVFFIMDATGSMGDELRYMNAELQDVIRRSQSAVEGTIIRTGALVYRDHGDDYLNRLSPLTDDISVTQAFLNEQHANGGGDYEEAVPEALMAAVNVADWSEEARARIAFLILDAPCHQDSTTIRLLHEYVRKAAESGIRVVPVVCSGLREAGELLMRELALLTNGTSFFLTDDSGIGDKHLKPTTDSLKVEHLNDMLVRTIIEFASMPDCDEQWADSALTDKDEEAFIPNPFSQEDLDSVPATAPVRPLDDVLRVRPNPCQGFCLVDLPLGADAVFLVDLTGKTLQSLGSMPAYTSVYSVSVGGYATGVYFIKAFVEGNWYTRKLIVR